MHCVQLERFSRAKVEPFSYPKDIEVFISYLPDNGATCIQLHDLTHENLVLLVTLRRGPREWSPRGAFPLSAGVLLSVNDGMQACGSSIF